MPGHLEIDGPFLIPSYCRCGTPPLQAHNPGDSCTAVFQTRVGVEERGNRARICSDELFDYPVSRYFPRASRTKSVRYLPPWLGRDGRHFRVSVLRPPLDSLVESAELLVTKEWIRRLARRGRGVGTPRRKSPGMRSGSRRGAIHGPYDGLSACCAAVKTFF
jgi:hypothetical protein